MASHTHIIIMLLTGVIVQVSAFLSMAAVVYMRIFLNESVPSGSNSGMRQSLLRESKEAYVEEECENNSSSRTKGIFKRLPSVGDLICLLKSRYLK